MSLSMSLYNHDKDCYAKSTQFIEFLEFENLAGLSLYDFVYDLYPTCDIFTIYHTNLINNIF